MPEFYGLGKRSLLASPRKTSCRGECAPRQERRDSECAGNTPPSAGAAALLLAAASKAQAHTGTHAPHHLSLEESGTGALRVVDPNKLGGTELVFRASSREGPRAGLPVQTPSAPWSYLGLT